MKKILYLLLALLTLATLHTEGQTFGPNSDSINIPVDGSGLTYRAIRIMPPAAGVSHNKYPTLFFFHGQGEQGNSLAIIANATSAGGPAYFNKQGLWPVGFTNPINGKTDTFIVISPQCPFNAPGNNVSTTPAQAEFMVTWAIANLPVDPTRIYFTGLSAGGPATIMYPVKIDNNCSTITSTHPIAAVIPMSADYNAGCMQTIGVGLANAGIGIWGFGDPVNDTHGANTSGMIYYANQARPGWATFTSYTGGHCCWNNFYTPTFTQTINGFNRNIYQWLLSYTTAPPSTAPIVNPGMVQNFSLPNFYPTALSGSATAGTGRTIVNYAWTQASGPYCTILNGSGAATIVSSILTAGTYVFRLTATDDIGQTGSANITLTVTAPKFMIRNGEYLNYIINNTTHRAFALGSPIGIGANTPHLGFAMPVVINAPNSNPNIVEGSFGLHNGLLLTDSGTVLVYTSDNGDGQMGNGTQTGNTNNMFVPITTDSSGAPFKNLVYIKAASSVFTPAPGFGSVFYGIKNNGTLWFWGNTQGGYGADTSYGRVITRPKMMKFPPGTFMVKVIAQDVALGVDSSGALWSWGGDVTSTNGHGYDLGDKNRTTTFTYPVKVALPAGTRVVDVVGAGPYSLVWLNNGQVYGFGFYTGYMGIGAVPSSSAPGFVNPGFPFRVDTALNIPAGLTLRKLSSNNATNYMILSDGSMRVWGANEAGQTGNGSEIDWPNYTIPPPYGGATPAPFNWNQDLADAQLQQHKPVDPTPGKTNWVDLSDGVPAVWYKFAIDANGRVYSTGRGKTGMLANGTFECDPIQGGISTSFPNGLDRTLWTPLDSLFTSDTTVYMTCPYCIPNPNVSPCSNCAVVPNTGPHAIAPNKSVATGAVPVLDGHTSTDDKRIVKWRWTQLTGPSTALLGIRASPTDTLVGLPTGVYTFQLKITDGGNLSDSTIMTLTVGTSAPTVSAGPTPLQINLPATTVTLVGSATAVSPATMSGVVWTQLPGGPNTATIVSPTATTTVVNNLIQGVYTFQIKGTDSNGLTATSTVTVNVGSCNCLNFGLPTKMGN